MSTQPTGQRGAIGAAFLVLLVAAIGAIALVAALSLAIGRTMESLGDGASFEAANAVFSGLAFAAVIVALTLQQRQLLAQNRRLADQLGEMSKSNNLMQQSYLTEQNRLQLELVSKAFDNPDLVPVLDTYSDDISAERQRQYLYANLWFCHILHNYRAGASEQEVTGHLRVWCRNAIFREYWAATREHRRALRYDSEEAHLGRVVDGIISRMDGRNDWWAS